MNVFRMFFDCAFILVCMHAEDRNDDTQIAVFWSFGPVSPNY